MAMALPNLEPVMTSSCRDGGLSIRALAEPGSVVDLEVAAFARRLAGSGPSSRREPERASTALNCACAASNCRTAWLGSSSVSCASVLSESTRSAFNNAASFGVCRPAGPEVWAPKEAAFPCGVKALRYAPGPTAEWMLALGKPGTLPRGGVVSVGAWSSLAMAIKVARITALGSPSITSNWWPPRGVLLARSTSAADCFLIFPMEFPARPTRKPARPGGTTSKTSSRPPP
mmetsp:Transcript_24254/g.61816  ORF Transcript_24254/g.61816 Transcript_24254/m.61816 type:complete len:231 (-) Transcript_24254:113-805(-)